MIILHIYAHMTIILHLPGRNWKLSSVPVSSPRVASAWALSIFYDDDRGCDYFDDPDHDCNYDRDDDHRLGVHDHHLGVLGVHDHHHLGDLVPRFTVLDQPMRRS